MKKQDETEYLLSSKANATRLMESIEQLNKEEIEAMKGIDELSDIITY